jgi:dTDP-4-amino-4,6-dideoxygalactose transaminase
MLEIRKANAELLSEGLKSFEQKGILKLPKESENNKFNWYLFTVGFKDNSHRELVKDNLLKAGIGATMIHLCIKPHITIMILINPDRVPIIYYLTRLGHGIMYYHYPYIH